jgi:hypothetical protein
MEPMKYFSQIADSMIKFMTPPVPGGIRTLGSYIRRENISKRKEHAKGNGVKRNNPEEAEEILLFVSTLAGLICMIMYWQ